MEVIRYLIYELEVDFLALGEITVDDLTDFLKKLEIHDYTFYDGTNKENRLQFDTGAIYRKGIFDLIDSKFIFAARGSRSFKVATRLDLMTPYSDGPLHIFISHWPGRLHCHEDSADRNLLGIRLRDAVNDINNTPASTILLGDYNDEPFNSSLAEQLLAVRDRSLIAKNPALLYNPFWRRLGEAFPYLSGKPCQSYSGSCFYKSGVDTHWRTFDQIIFSSAFLGKGDWHLDEHHTTIVHMEPFIPYVLKTNEIFDHLPVITVIERGESNG